MLVERGLCGRPGIGGAVVAGHADDGPGELTEPLLPGPQPGAKDAEGIARAAEGVAAVVVGPVGVVIDGPEQTGGAESGVPPRPQQGPGAPEDHPGYPPAV
jgi:hypothetical protein